MDRFFYYLNFYKKYCLFKNKVYICAKYKFMKKEKSKRPAWRPNAEDPKKTITFGIEKSKIEKLGGEKNVSLIAKEHVEKQAKKIK